jgi:restriction system protein
MMLPALRLVAERPYGTAELVEALADFFRLDAVERNARFRSGNKRIIENRTHWALDPLMKAGLVERPARATYSATARGREVLEAPPERMTVAFLRSLMPHDECAVEAKDGAIGIGEPSGLSEVATQDADPRERLDAALAEMDAGLAQNLFERLSKPNADFFERVVLDVIRAMGYGGTAGPGETRAKHLGRSGDGGVDGLIEEDALGLDVIYLQAKQYKNTVTVGHVREFAGALEDHGSSKGVLIALSTFTAEARAFAQRSRSKKIVLIDGPKLVSLMIQYGVGVRTRRQITIREIDGEYFQEA